MPFETDNDTIKIRGARVHNLKNIQLDIPRDRLVVVTGLSGSGKSSLAFDTLYAEGQRRYVESLSAYARQFLGRINKPDVDLIHGIPPAIAIEQRVNTRNPRSTVGTSTEVYEYLKLLYARIGQTISPVSGKVVRRHSVTDVVDFVTSLPPETRLMVLAPLAKPADRSWKDHFEMVVKQGFTRVESRGAVVNIHELLAGSDLDHLETGQVMILVDRLVADPDSENLARLADSVQTAFFESHGAAVIRSFETTEGSLHWFSNRFEEDGLEFEEPSVHMFSFNNPLGACPRCEGYGKIIGIDEDLVVPDKTLSVYADAIACWRGEKLSAYKDELIQTATQFGFPIHKPYFELKESERRLIWTGNQFFTGITAFFELLERENYKIQNRVLLARYRGKTLCPECGGARLKKEAANVRVGGVPIHELVLMPVSSLLAFFQTLKLTAHDRKIAGRLLVEILSRLEFLDQVGLGYLTLNRLSSTLSGGESQRINLATSLGSSLVGSLYILDEPSIGLHARDTQRLISVLRKLRDLGNTVLVVEHDEEIIRAADQVIDMGPLAGIHGGEVVFQGGAAQMSQPGDSLTVAYLTGKMNIPLPLRPRKWSNFIQLLGVRENNLKNLEVKFPLNVMTAVTGVSGSGKSSLVSQVLYPALKRYFDGYAETSGHFDVLQGDLHLIKQVEFVDQNPIGRSTRSNPVTYIKAYDEVRKLYGELPQARHNGLTPSHFSFNIDGGRCPECQGEGIIRVEMQFMADVTLVCESCGGKRFKEDVLEVRYHGKNVFELLQLSVDEAIAFFAAVGDAPSRKIAQRLQPLADVGLGYVKLGQSSSTLSGGESQRVKLASFLTRENSPDPILFIFDEPTTGLHFHDVRKLLDAFHALIDKGHSLIVVEHNLDIIKNADWVIDLGPEGGQSGGNLVFQGIPSDLLTCPQSYTGRFLAEKFNA